MMTRTIGCLFVALVAVTYALPVVEDTWAPEDELLQRVFSDSTPMSLMQADPSTIKHADEAKFAKEESDLTAKAAKLKEASAKLRDAATAANQKAASDAAANAADTMKKAQEAAAATAKAEAAGAKFQAEMKKLQADLAKQDGDAAAATKARIAKVEAELKANDEAKAKAQADGKAAAAALKKSGEDLAAEKKKILDDYNSKTAAMGAKLKADTAKLDADHKAMEDKFDKMDMDNAAKAKAATAAVAAEKAQNDKDAAAEKAAIKSKYDKIAAAHAKANAAWDAKAAADKAALDATREATKKDFEKKAAAAQADYDAKMAHAATLKKIADEAAAALAASVKKSEEDQKAADAAANAADAKDAEDTECAIDGSECRAEDGTCKKISDKGPYLGDDYVSCSDKPGDHGGEYGGEAWMGADNAPAAVVPEEPSDECKKLLDANADAKKAMENKEDCPVVVAACGDNDGKLGDDKDTPAKYAKVIAAVNAICDAMGECPEYCYPGTGTTTDDGVTDTLGNCIDKGTYAGFKQMIGDMPVYEKSGTNGRFTAGDPGPALCKAIRDASCAAAAVGGSTPKTCPEELFLLQADPSTIKHAADAKAKADAEAKEAGADEAKFAKEESDLTAKAAKLKE